MSTYRQRSIVERLHGFPRFGNPNDIAYLASEEGDFRDDYVRGITAMTLLFSFFIISWAAVLLFLKIRYTPDQLGCAVKGRVIDVGKLREQRVPRSERKQRILRAWRLQTAFFVASLLIPFFSFLLMNKGYRPLMDSIRMIDRLNDDAYVRAKSGIEIAYDIRLAYYQLKPTTINTQICQDTTLEGIDLETLNTHYQEGIDSLQDFVDTRVNQVSESLQEFLVASNEFEEGVQTVYELDWIIKAILVSLNIVNFLLFCGVGLTKNNINSKLAQQVFAFVLVPLFCVLLFATTFGFGISLIGAIANADFCSGGHGSGSPHGTFQDILLLRGNNQSSLAFESLEFFGDGCFGSNPLSFIQSARAEPDEARIYVEDNLSAINSLDLTSLSSECVENISDTNFTLTMLDNVLSKVDDRLQLARTMTSCSTLSPLFESLYEGPVCTDSINGQVWLFTSLLVMTCAGLTMLTTRAALYNPIRKAKHRKRREKEFEDYKAFMAEYYDVSKWDIDCVKEAKMLIKPVATFDTENSDESNSEEPREIPNSPARSALPSIADFRRRRADSEESDESLYSYHSSDEDSNDDQMSFLSTSMSILVDKFLGFRNKSQETTRNQPTGTRTLPQSMLGDDPDESASESDEKIFDDSMISFYMDQSKMMLDESVEMSVQESVNQSIDSEKAVLGVQAPKAPKKSFLMFRRTEGSYRIDN